MPSTPQSSEEALDDDAIITLLKYADWDVEYDDLDQEWHVRPPDQKYAGFAAFTNLKAALEYMMMYRKLYE